MYLKRTVLLILILITVFLDNVYSQSAGESTYQFLNISTSPRQLALGGKTITNFGSDVTSGLYNPSTINPEMDNILSVNYFSYFSDISFGSLSYAYTLDNRGNTIHFGFSYINYGDFMGYDEYGNFTSEFTGNESVLSVGYANNINNLPIRIGANLKFITSTFEQYNSYGLAADFGLFYTDENDINMSLVFRNIGFQIKLWDFDFACIPGIVDNNKVEADWTKKINVVPEQHKYYDVHYFFNTLTKKGFFPQFWTDESISDKVKDFVKRVIPNNLTKGKNVTERGRLLSKEEFMTPDYILKNDPFFKIMRS